MASLETTTRLATVLVTILMLARCSSIHRELSDDEWCKSFEYAAGTRDYAECRARIERQRQRARGEGARP
jgi:hypothetical protein